MVSSSVVPFNSREEVWRRALARAQARPYVVEYLGERTCKGTPMDFFRVSSNSEPGNWHNVSVCWFGAGQHAVSCDCKAGERQIVCMHAAIVLRDLGILDDPFHPDGPDAPAEMALAA